MGEPSLWTHCSFAAFYQQVGVLGIKSMHSEWEGGNSGGFSFCLEAETDQTSKDQRRGVTQECFQ